VPRIQSVTAKSGLEGTVSVTQEVSGR